MESADRPRIVRFGVFEVDLRSNELFKDGHKIKIQELPFQILVALLEQPGEVVTREELQHRLWPQDTFVDFDHSLNTAVRLLRLALGDAAENPKFVETLPRKGYRFIYPVESLKRIITEGEVAQTRHPEGLRSFETSGHPISLEAPEPSHALPLLQLPHERETVQEQPAYHSAPEPEVELQDFVLGTKQSQATVQKKKHQHVWAVAAIAVVLVVAGSMYWMRWRGTRELEPALVPVPFTAYPNVEWEPSFSPDGKQVAFAWNGEKGDNFDIYIKQIGSESRRRLTADPRIDGHCAWSPDGQTIAFLRYLGHDHRAVVMMIPANGGRERQVMELGVANTEGTTRLLCWHPGGKWLAVSCDQESTQEPAAIYLLSPETREKRKLTFPPKGVRQDTSPAFSPDGRSLVFLRYFRGLTSEIYLLRVSEELVP
ncbi:MAG TPA: winged helix-turn-helix domain-containing protein, partial [Terriglobia bacterium]|nr:winged helix-turn-helix domain-containing protein [Terriglobia bacterium]